ncbi:MAG: oligosaccharide flippase family protein [Candidatus Aenigmarchaeota archaeon]|nr:oligosaccharide flippase family protein [Candidatus Aenigmarchaeota archaeon]
MIIDKIRHQLNKDSGLLKHASILFFAMTIGNFMNYLFQLYMGRALGPEKYGILGALISLMYIMTIPGGTIQTFITKYVSKFSVKEPEAIGWILSVTFKKLLVVGAVFLFLFTIFSPYIASFLKIPDVSLVISTGVILVLSLFLPLFYSALRGIQDFNGMGLTNIINFTSKLLLGVVLVSLGFGVFGALVSIGTGSLLGIIFSVYLLRKYLLSRKKPKKTDIGFRYFWYVLFTMFFIVLFYNIDIILVKRFFPPVDAGYYVAASTMAKIIFFISTPIIVAMFPKASEIKEKDQSTYKILKHTMIYVSILGILGVVFFNLFPNFVVSMLFGSQYTPTVHMIGLFSLGMLFFSLINVITQHHMAVDNLSYLPILTLGAILEVVGIILYHSTLFDVVKIFTISMAFVFFLLLILDKKRKKI